MADYQSSYTGQEIDAGITKANTSIQPSDLNEYFISEGGIPYTNLVDVSQIELNKRWNSSGTLTNDTGYVALPLIPFTNDTETHNAILRINRPATVLVPATTGKNCRVSLCDASGNYTSYSFNGKYINNYTPVEEEDGYFKCNLAKKYST